jgi:hypothetical protein
MSDFYLRMLAPGKLSGAMIDNVPLVRVVIVVSSSGGLAFKGTVLPNFTKGMGTYGLRSVRPLEQSPPGQSYKRLNHAKSSIAIAGDPCNLIMLLKNFR